MSLYIFCYIKFIIYALLVSILWPLRFGRLLVCCLYNEVYLQIFKRVSFWLHGCCGEREGLSWVAVVTPTDRPKSVRSRCVIKLFCGVVCVVTLPFLHFCWCRAFVIGLSQIYSFFSCIQNLLVFLDFLTFKEKKSFTNLKIFLADFCHVLILN